MKTTAELEELISRATESVWGPELSGLLETALALAVERGDESGEYRVRLVMANNAQMMGDTDRLLTNFAWCLAKHDDDPLTFPIEPDDGSDLMWQFKWMVGVLGADPRFSTEQISAVLADMDDHFRKANLGLSGVAMARFESAFHNGHLEQARAAFSALTSTERDNYSHCDACVRSVAMEYHFSIGEQVAGARAFTEIMEGGFSCGEEPEHAISVALLPLLRAGDTDGLASLHRRSYREARGNADNVGIVANHVAFCALTGNEARGVTLAERHLAWLAHDPLSHRKHLNFLSALGLLLEKVVAGGHGEIPIRGTEHTALIPFFGQRSEVLSAAELAPLCWQAAEALAADFDARNGNDWHARQIAARKDMVTETYPLSLGDETFGSPEPRPVAEPRSTEQWRVRAMDLCAAGLYDAALAAYASGVRGTENPRELAALHRSAISIHGQLPGQKHQDLLLECVALRAAALRAAGDPELASLTERADALLTGPDKSESNDEKLAVINSELLALAEHPEALCLLTAELAHILVGLGKLEEARTALVSLEQAIDDWAASAHAGPVAAGVTSPAAHPSDETIVRARSQYASLMLHVAVEGADVDEMNVWVGKSLEHETSVVRRASALGLRARLAAQRGELASALADAEESTELLAGLGARESVAQSTQLTAAILQDLGRTDELRSRLRFGIQQAKLAESPYVLGLAYSLAKNLVDHGSDEEAIEVLDETLNNSGVDIGDHDRGELYDLLGTSLRSTGEPGGALNAWTLGLDCFEANGEADRVAQLHMAMSSTYQEAGHFEAAAEEAQSAVDVLSAALAGESKNNEQPEVDHPALIAAYMQLAEMLSTGGAEGATEAIDTATALAISAKSDVQTAEIQLVRARHLFRTGEVDAAVAQALQASSALELLDDAQQQSLLALLQAAHMLDNAKRHDDAVAIYHAVLGALEGDRQGQEIVRHQLADCLEAAGRSAEAASVRAEAEEDRQHG
ncbi:hypothetical protein AS189_17670 [Arthrobacter alpinus]|uniref:Tetratricopeptide repeat protein n=1 Tax=Arthrobacter alpinus TaxID=656366 RepID=A0A0S2M321_9MICC|nr:hypothetical protein [Arthrobacter alpinus]ALO67980.1 hypothetical protein AS189_17670 [Arthrobacter alpinus]